MYFHMGLVAAVVVVDFDSGFVDVFVFVFFFFFSYVVLWLPK